MNEAPEPGARLQREVLGTVSPAFVPEHRHRESSLVSFYG